MRINASKTKVLSALIPGEQHQTVLLDGEPLGDVEKFKYLGATFVVNGQGTEEIRNRITLARSAFSRLTCLCSSLCPVRVAGERMLEVFDNDSIRRILRVRRRDCVPSVELCHRLCLTSIPALLVQGRLRWFGQAARRPECELIKDLLLPTPPRTWR